MKLETFCYKSEGGWDIDTFPDLDSESTLVLIFCAPELFDTPEPIYEIAKHYPKAKILGCSSAGEISGGHILDHSLSVAVAKFEKTEIRIMKTEITEPTESFDAGKKISSTLLGKDLKGIFILSDGLNVNGSELVKGLNTIANKDVVITGGLAGDGTRFKRTWSIYNGEIILNKIIAVGFYGDHVQIGHGSRGGWDSFGPERRITRSKDNVLYELDGKPALALYKEYLGDLASGLPATGLLYPLAIRKDETDDKPLVRTILGLDEKDQSLTFAGDVPTGYLAKLMRGNFERIINAADEAGELAHKTLWREDLNKATPVLAIAVSCVGRRLLLGERTEEETESTLEALPKGTKQVGFYSYGEVSPYLYRGCDLHNQTMTLTTICED